MAQNLLRDRLLDCVIPEDDEESVEEESIQGEVDDLPVKREYLTE